MTIELVVPNIKLSDKYKEKIITKYDNALSKLLSHLNDDQKHATLTLEKMARFGYRCRFDMPLPGGTIFAEQYSPLLFVGTLRLRDQVKRQIKKHFEKMKVRR